MAYLNFSKATSSEREALAQIRAEAWAKELSKEEFCERNKILYAHSFGKNRIETFLLKNPEHKIVSSMDALRVKFFFRESNVQRTEIKDGFLIASVMTPIQHRRKGYASFLLKSFLEHQKTGLGVLYSDIGPKFYERYGFQKTTIQMREMNEPFPSGDAKIVGLDIQEWVDKVRAYRQQRFEATTQAQMAMVPEVEFWDWQIERFRFFSNLKGKGALPPSFFEVQTPEGATYFCLVPNALTGAGEVLWFDAEAPEILGKIGKIAGQLGLKKVHFWSSKDLGRVMHEECPMGWFQGAAKPHPEGFYDPQLCDWW